MLKLIIEAIIGMVNSFIFKWVGWIIAAELQEIPLLVL